MTKRRVIQVVVFLLLGAIVNFAVAWGCARFVKNPTPTSTVDSDSEGFPTRVQVEFDGWAVKRRAIFQLVSPNDVIKSHLKQGMPLNPYPIMVAETTWEHRAGAPCVSLQRTEHTGIAAPTAVAPLNIPAQLEFRLYDPVWPGFAINTIFYAAVLWMLFAFPFVLRRRRRIKRGLCPACAYPVGTSPVCTECGKDLPA